MNTAGFPCVDIIGKRKKTPQSSRWRFCRIPARICTTGGWSAG